MSVHIIRPRRRRREEGIALVVVLLFTAVVLTIVVSTTATLALGARGGGVNERAAYQALLAAESGQNTFLVRAMEHIKTQPYTGKTNADLATWLNNFRSSTLETVNGVTFSFENLSASAISSTFTVVAEGTQLGAKKAVLQNYELRQAAPFRLRARAGLTSLPPIDGNGSMSVSGRANDGIAATVRSTNPEPEVTTTSTAITLPVATTDAIVVGDYVKVNNITFKVNSKTSQSLELTPVSPVNSKTTLNGEVTVLLNAVGAPYSTVDSTTNIKVSNLPDLFPGETLVIGGKTAVLRSVDLNSGAAQFDWPQGTPTSLPEGTQVFRDIRALRSAGNILPKENKLDDVGLTSGGSFSPDCTETPVGGSGGGKKDKVTTEIVCAGEEDPLLRSPVIDNNPFTQQILGLTDAELESAIPRDPDGEGTLPQGEIKRITAADFDNLFKGNATGSGVLIVDGDINTQINGNVTFNGFIYFRGNLGGKLNGSLLINGAVAVRGGKIENLTSDDVTTNATGNMTLKYDGVELRKRLLNASGQFKGSTVQGTWRQR